MKTKYIKSLMISGISTTTNNENERSEENQKIAPLWEKYDTDKIYGKTFNKANNTALFAVYSNYTDGLNGDYEVTVGVEVSKPKNAIAIENQKYLLFTKEGELPDVVTDTWEEIWSYFKNNSEYERAYKTDFEQYSKEDEIDIYISIK
ncbi:MAG: GyrI-like domain-containing protein [Campylobacterota bacterium]|nr:GyrI-like domain-containing protein [Campylobacterota bacterium]